MGCAAVLKRWGWFFTQKEVGKGPCFTSGEPRCRARDCPVLPCRSPAAPPAAISRWHGLCRSWSPSLFIYRTKLLIYTLVRPAQGARLPSCPGLSQLQQPLSLCAIPFPHRFPSNSAAFHFSLGSVFPLKPNNSSLALLQVLAVLEHEATCIVSPRFWIWLPELPP